MFLHDLGERRVRSAVHRLRGVFLLVVELARHDRAGRRLRPLGVAPARRTQGIAIEAFTLPAPLDLGQDSFAITRGPQLRQRLAEISAVESQALSPSTARIMYRFI